MAGFRLGDGALKGPRPREKGRAIRSLTFVHASWSAVRANDCNLRIREMVMRRGFFPASNGEKPRELSWVARWSVGGSKTDLGDVPQKLEHGSGGGSGRTRTGPWLPRRLGWNPPRDGWKIGLVKGTPWLGSDPRGEMTLP
jgi:hypothetical protein